MDVKNMAAAPAIARSIALDAYNYPLREEQIAKFPLQERASCKLLCYQPQTPHFRDLHFRDLPDLLAPTTLLLRNNSRVIHARILMEKATGARVEIFCLSPARPAAYDECLASHDEVTWHCLIGNAKKWKDETIEKRFTLPSGETITLWAKRSAEDPFCVTFRHSATHLSFGEVLEAVGSLPIPPYLGRATQESDLRDYQTLYATQEGSVAAPTAGLHFTDEVDEQIHQRGINIQEVTLHVGAGTFLPVKGDDIANHQMHSEVCGVRQETIRAILTHKDLGACLAVGTTTVRTVESLYYLALNHLHEIATAHGAPQLPHIDQWEPYCSTPADAYALLDRLLRTMEQLRLEQIFFSTALFIIPSYKFHYITQLVTNFHQPKSTLLLMISAFIGDTWQALYRHALESGYRFLSYGDACLLSPTPL